jgi:hypothetical protein
VSVISAGHSSLIAKLPNNHSAYQRLKGQLHHPDLMLQAMQELIMLVTEQRGGLPFGYPQMLNSLPADWTGL